jgi:hypothetical protein
MNGPEEVRGLGDHPAACRRLARGWIAGGHADGSRRLWWAPSWLSAPGRLWIGGDRQSPEAGAVPSSLVLAPSMNEARAFEAIRSATSRLPLLPVDPDPGDLHPDFARHVAENLVYSCPSPDGEGRLIAARRWWDGTMAPVTAPLAPVRPCPLDGWRLAARVYLRTRSLYPGALPWTEAPNPARYVGDVFAVSFEDSEVYRLRAQARGAG